MPMAVTAGGSIQSAREARRRRILERGSDRLALITGQIQSLPPDLDPYQSPASTCTPGQILPPDFSQHEDTSANPLLPNEETGRERGVPDETVEPLPHSSQNGVYISSRSAHQAPSSTQKPAPDRRGSLFTAGQIRSAIAASENARMICSVAFAVLVIASYMGFPVAGIMVLRPVYLLFLTNITIALGWGILGESRTGRRGGAPTTSGNALADQLGKALGIGLLMQKITGALFMDFSIYAVVLVSGLSLIQKLGW